MTDREAIAEIEERGWKLKTEPQYKLSTHPHRAFFRGWLTPWRSTVLEVLADVRAYQNPELNKIQQPEKMI